MGRQPMELTDEIIEIICQEISRGVPIKYACLLAHVSTTTYYKWKKKGEKEDETSTSQYRKFVDALQEAEAKAVALRVEQIRLDPSWQSSAWWLERMAHDYFGKKQTIDANVDANIRQADISKLFDNEEVNKILREEEKEE